MRQLASGLWVAGSIAVVVGLLGLLSMLLQKLGVAFVFAVTPWYGPFLGGLLFLGAGWFLRSQSAAPIRSDV